MLRGSPCLLLLLGAGCVTKPAPQHVDLPAHIFRWPQWTTTSTSLLELPENAGYAIVVPAANESVVDVNEAPTRSVATAHAPSPAQPAPSPPRAPSSVPTPVRAVAPREPAATEYLEPGKRLSLAVTAEGRQPMSYQWRKDAQPIQGETRASFVIETVRAEDSGLYDCIVKNDAGEVLSEPVKLVVRPN